MKGLQDGDGGRGAGWRRGVGGTTALKFALRSVGSLGKLDKAPRPSSVLGEPTRRWHRLQSSLGWKSMALCPLLPALDLAPYLKAALILRLYFRAGFFPPAPLLLPPLYFFFLFFYYINPTSLFEMTFQNHWKRLPRDVVAFSALVVHRAGLMQGRVAWTWAASDYQDLRQGYCNSPASLFWLKT